MPQITTKEQISQDLKKLIYIFLHPRDSMKKALTFFSEFSESFPAYSSAALAFYIIILSVPALTIIALASTLCAIGSYNRVLLISALAKVAPKAGLGEHGTKDFLLTG